MKRIAWGVVIAMVGIGMAGAASWAGTEEAERKGGPDPHAADVAAAVAGAESWLGLVDAGDYAKSWDEAAAYFRGALSKDKWQESLNGARKPLGSLVSRKVQSTSYETALPGAPDGEYVVIQFQTSFQSKKSAVETVTPMKEKDGKWRVSGYFIK